MTKNNRKNKSNKPKRQRESRTTAPSAYGTNIPKSEYQIRTVGPNMISVKGHEFLVDVVKRASPPAFLLAAYTMNPACWTGSRLQNLARSYELYRFKKVELHYHPSVGTTTQGAISVGFETDPNEGIPAGANFFQQSLSNAYSNLGPIWAQVDVSYLKPGVDFRWWHCSVEEGNTREVNQMYAYAVSNVPVIGAATTTVGHLTCSYEIEFMYPEKEAITGQGNFGDTVITSSGATTAGTPVSAQFSNADARILEGQFTDAFTPLTFREKGRNFRIDAGDSLFFGYNDNGSNWLVYSTLEAARLGGEGAAALGVLTLNYLVDRFLIRPLSAGLTAIA
jgi:hypothetical protein